MKLITWNVNGIRAAAKKGFLNWITTEKPGVLGIQEIKAMTSQINPELQYIPGYNAHFNPAERKGYSGTAIYSTLKPKEVTTGFGIERFDREGRIQVAEYDDFTFLNIYFPNGKMNAERLQYKLDFYDAAREFFEKLVKKGHKLLISGDYNTAHKEIDLARPKENEEVSGFLPVERIWFDELISLGYIDCFREFDKGPENYTWWSMRSGARERNVGWRIDYFFASKNARDLLKNCYHLPNLIGSDHCPVVLEI